MNDEIRTSLILAFFSGMAFSIVRLALTFKLRTDIGARAIEVTSLTTGFMVARAVFSPIGGTIGDKLPRSRYLISSTLLFPSFVITLLFRFSINPIKIIFLNFLHGVFSGIFWPTIQVIVGYSSPRDKRGVLLGTYFTLAGIGSSIGYSLYGKLSLSNDEFLLLGSLFYLMSAIVSLKFLRSWKKTNSKYEWSKDENEARRRVGEELPEKFVLLSAFLLGGVMGLSGEYLYLFLREVHELSKEELGYLLTSSSIVGIMSGISSGYVLDRLGVRKSLLFIISLSSMSLLVISLRIGRILLTLSVLGMSFSSWGSMPITRNVSSFRRSKGTLVGLSNSLSNLGSASFPLLAGHLYDTLGGRAFGPVLGESIPFLVASFFSISLLLLYVLIERD